MGADSANNGLYMTVDQYFALDEATDGKYEYLDGYAFLLRPPSSVYDNHEPYMVTNSIAHAALCARIALMLGNALIESPCTIYTTDAHVKLAEKQYLYPDVAISCDPETGLMLANPTVIIEVLSPATEKRDRSAKCTAYEALQSVQEYVLVESEYRLIEVHRREDNFWRPYQYHEDDTVELKSLGIRFTVDQVYHRINV